jgi:hypothetical protein
MLVWGGYWDIKFCEGIYYFMKEQIEGVLQTTPVSPFQSRKSVPSKTWFFPTLLFVIGYILCVMATTIPLYLGGSVLPIGAGTTKILITPAITHHLPTNPQIVQSSAQKNIAFLAFLLLLLCLFTIYIFYALYIRRQEEHVIRNRHAIILLSIGITTVLAACIYIFTPATLSNDIYLYAEYGRILWIHHANPYFTPPLSFPHDPLYSSVYWKSVVAVYGPVWMLVCALLTSFSSTDPMQLFVVFRVFACIIHFTNAALIYAILRTRGYSVRTILTGTLLYALNPLVLFESSTGAHNDILMTMFVLLGIFYAVRAEKSEKFRLTHYIPALIALALAVLVKFTIVPVVVLFIIMLSFKASSSATTKLLSIGERWRIGLLTMLLASIICAGVLFLFYGPFWLGHSIKSIEYIFSSQPEAVFSFTSLLSALQIWNSVHPLPTLLVPITNLHLWNIIIYGGMALVLILGGIRLRRAPTTQKAVFATLAVMAVFLLTTNWFLAWYVICPLAMAVICLPIVGNYSGYSGHLGRGLLAFTFTFSFSAFLTYYFNFVGSRNLHAHPPHIAWLIVCYAATFILPVLAFLVFFADKTKEVTYLRHG